MYNVFLKIFFFCMGINVLKKKERNKGILIDGGFFKIFIFGLERRDFLIF